VEREKVQSEGSKLSCKLEDVDEASLSFHSALGENRLDLRCDRRQRDAMLMGNSGRRHPATDPMSDLCFRFGKAEERLKDCLRSDRAAIAASGDNDGVFRPEDTELWLGDGQPMKDERSAQATLPQDRDCWRTSAGEIRHGWSLPKPAFNRGRARS
jgi:hypothetical protein